MEIDMRDVIYENKAEQRKEIIDALCDHITIYDVDDVMKMSREEWKETIQQEKQGNREFNDAMIAKYGKEWNND